MKCQYWLEMLLKCSNVVVAQQTFWGALRCFKDSLVLRCVPAHVLSYRETPCVFHSDNQQQRPLRWNWKCRRSDHRIVKRKTFLAEETWIELVCRELIFLSSVVTPFAATCPYLIRHSGESFTLLKDVLLFSENAISINFWGKHSPVYQYVHLTHDLPFTFQNFFFPKCSHLFHKTPSVLSDFPESISIYNLWNDLPPSLQSTTSLSLFKINLKGH